MKTSDVLRKAGDVLRERGWCQFLANNFDGSHCVLGALWNVTKSTSGSDAEDILDVITLGHASIADWNDADGRTADDAAIALDAAYVLALQCEGIDPEDVL